MEWLTQCLISALLCVLIVVFVAFIFSLQSRKKGINEQPAQRITPETATRLPTESETTTGGANKPPNPRRMRYIFTIRRNMNFPIFDNVFPRVYKFTMPGGAINENETPDAEPQGPKVVEIFNDAEKLRINNPLPLTHKALAVFDLSQFVWLEKTDGKFKRIITDNYVIDVEELDGVFYCFDVLVIDGADVRNCSFSDRMKLAEETLNGEKYNETPIKIKHFNRFTSLGDLFKLLRRSLESGSGKNDGIILQQNSVYIDEENSDFYNTIYDKSRIFKLKLPQLNTVDFRLKYIGENVFKLYLTGNYCRGIDKTETDENAQRSSVSENGETITDSDNQEQTENETRSAWSDSDNQPRESLFISPFFVNSYLFDLNELKNINLNDFPEHMREEITRLSKALINSPEYYDGRIIELSYDGERYTPLKIRDDKPFPNKYFVGVTNLSLVWAPLEETTNDAPQYFEKITENADSIEFHKRSRYMRHLIFKKLDLFKQTGSRLSCLNLGAGRGADNRLLYSRGYKNLFCVDNDKPALCWLAENTYRDKLDELWLNVINYDLNNDLSGLAAEIKERNEDPGRFNLVFMNFAIHYIKHNLEKLNSFIREICGGIFAFTFFDGDYITENPDEEYELTKNKKTKIEIKNGIGKFPLITIDKNEFREEPLILREDLKVFGDNFKEFKLFEKGYFKLVILRIYDLTGNG